MTYIFISILVFLLSASVVYLTTYKKYIGNGATVKGVLKTQYFRILFAIAVFFTLIVMLLIKAFQS
jgi:hypothetical protein